MVVVRVILFPFKLAFALLGTTFRVGYQAGKAPARLSFSAARRIGFKGWFFLLFGLALGLLFAPGPGRQLRHKLQKLLAGPAVSDTELDTKVTFELAHAPRTWHLPQPDVTVVGGRVRLSGTVSTADERDELARVAGAIPGVAAVENLVTVAAAS